LVFLQFLNLNQNSDWIIENDIPPISEFKSWITKENPGEQARGRGIDSIIINVSVPTQFPQGVVPGHLQKLKSGTGTGLIPPNEWCVFLNFKTDAIWVRPSKVRMKPCCGTSTALIPPNEWCAFLNF